jgi:hypothetical protein
MIQSPNLLQPYAMVFDREQVLIPWIVVYMHGERGGGDGPIPVLIYYIGSHPFITSYYTGLARVLHNVHLLVRLCIDIDADRGVQPPLEILSVLEAGP